MNTKKLTQRQAIATCINKKKMTEAFDIMRANLEKNDRLMDEPADNAIDTMEETWCSTHIGTGGTFAYPERIDEYKRIYNAALELFGIVIIDGEAMLENEL